MSTKVNFKKMNKDRLIHFIKNHAEQVKTADTALFEVIGKVDSTKNRAELVDIAESVSAIVNEIGLALYEEHVEEQSKKSEKTESDGKDASDEENSEPEISIEHEDNETIEEEFVPLVSESDNLKIMLTDYAKQLETHNPKVAEQVKAVLNKTFINEEDELPALKIAVVTAENALSAAPVPAENKKKKLTKKDNKKPAKKESENTMPSGKMYELTFPEELSIKDNSGKERLHLYRRPDLYHNLEELIDDYNKDKSGTLLDNLFIAAYWTPEDIAEYDYQKNANVPDELMCKEFAYDLDILSIESIAFRAIRVMCKSIYTDAYSRIDRQGFVPVPHKDRRTSTGDYVMRVNAGCPIEIYSTEPKED